MKSYLKELSDNPIHFVMKAIAGHMLIDLLLANKLAIEIKPKKDKKSKKKNK